MPSQTLALMMILPIACFKDCSVTKFDKRNDILPVSRVATAFALRFNAERLPAERTLELPLSIKALMSAGLRWAHSAATELCGMFAMTHAMAEASSSSAPSALTKFMNFSANLGEKTSKLKSASDFFRNLSIGQVISQVAANQPSGRAEGG